MTPISKIDLAILALSIIFPLALLQQMLHLQGELKENLVSLNISVKHEEINNPEIVVFARVPKTGSLAINTMLEQLRDIHNYSVFRQVEGAPSFGDEFEHTYYPDEGNRKLLFESLVNYPIRPVMLARHVNFFDYAELYPQDLSNHPTHFSFVRHPVDRAISFYYYVRSINYFIEDDQVEISPGVLPIKALKEPIEDCLARNSIECRWEQGMKVHGSQMGGFPSQMSFFCGHHPDCNKFESEALYNRAVENFEKHFAVVGVLELFNQSIQVLEAYLPRYFKGAQQLLIDKPEIMSTNQNSAKPKVSSNVKRILSANMTKEIDFYYLVRQRLLRQYKAISILE